MRSSILLAASGAVLAAAGPIQERKLYTKTDVTVTWVTVTVTAGQEDAGVLAYFRGGNKYQKTRTRVIPTTIIVAPTPTPTTVVVETTTTPPVVVVPEPEPTVEPTVVEPTPEPAPQPTTTPKPQPSPEPEPEPEPQPEPQLALPRGRGPSSTRLPPAARPLRRNGPPGSARRRFDPRRC